MVVPPQAVVVPGSRPLAGNEDGIHIHLPVIVKYKDAKTAAAVALESALRDRNGQD